MARPFIENADERIIHATIAVACHSDPGVFSTRKIAVAAHVSEYMIYDHFHNKKNLINACMMYLNGRYLHAVLDEAAKPHADSFAFFNGFLDRMMAEPEETSFSLNYSEVFPREKKRDYYPLYAKLMMEAFHPFKDFAFSKDLSIETWVNLLAFGIRETIQDANFLLAKQVKDTPENRATMCRLIFQGLSSFLPKKE
jgi:AcrR family transcriptional regulator